MNCSKEFPLRYITLTLLSLLVLASPDSTMGQFVVAHRGASHDAPENTLAAFRLAWDRQADAIEGDFYLTKDGRIVCIHDKTTKRVAPGQSELSVAASTLEELQQLDVGSWKHERYATERIPTLDDVLATIPDGKVIFVEIKCGPEIMVPLQKRLEASGLGPEQIVIICFNEAVVKQSRELMPQYKCSWLTGYKQQDDQGEWKPSQVEVVKTLKRLGATGLGTQGNLEVIDQKFVDDVRLAGFEFHVWTINDANEARTYADFGAHSVTTDRPAFIRRAIQTVTARAR
jgi:glycerophosphoryl diester phosphodiesterase